MEAQTHQVTTVGRTPSLSISSAQEDRRRRSSTNTSQHSGAYSFSPDRTERRKPSSTANPFLSSPNRKVSSNVSPRSEGFTTDPKHRGQADVLPTYRMEPLPDRKFRPHVVKRIMNEAFEESLDALRSYDSVKCRALTTQLCEDIKQRVKWLNYERCKLVCLVHIGSVSGQGMRVASQCLWDQNVDNFASTSYRKGDIFAVALLFAVYKE